MRKISRMLKKIQGNMSLVREEVPRKVLMKIEDGDTGKTKCASFVEIADTPYLRRLGLSKRASLGKSSGMYFDCRGPFWMKDVEFPLDLCYMDEYGAITEKVAMPEDRNGSRTYPRCLPESVQAVEFPAGYCERHGISLGDVLVPISRID